MSGTRGPEKAAYSGYWPDERGKQPDTPRSLAATVGTCHAKSLSRPARNLSAPSQWALRRFRSLVFPAVRVEGLSDDSAQQKESSQLLGEL